VRQRRARNSARTYFQMVLDRIRVQTQESHACSRVTEATCAQVDVKHTSHLFHLVVAQHLPIRPQEIKVQYRTLLATVLKVRVSVELAAPASIPMLHLKQGVVHGPF